MISQAQNSIWLWSAWVASRVHTLLPLAAVGRGVKVTVFVRDPSDTLQQKQRFKEALAALRAVVPDVIEVNVTHEKVVVIDNHTVMLGSLNALSQQRSREVMVTMRGHHCARKLLSHLHAEEFSKPPRCGACNGNQVDLRRRAGQRVMESITRFITEELKLKVNEAKSAVARPQERKFLGFSFSAGPEVKRVIAPKALGRFKGRIREITRRAKGVSMKTTMEELVPYMRGWRNDLGFCETPVVLQYLTRWVRLRLRAARWRQWKTQRRRRANLSGLGVRAAGEQHGWQRSWPLVPRRSTVLSVGLSNAYFRSLGLPSLVDEC